MKFNSLKDLILGYHWLSVSEIFFEIYPDQKEYAQSYAEVYERLRRMDPTESEFQIVLSHEMGLSVSEEEEESYVSVSGKKTKPISSEESDSYAIEFQPWSEWLAMTISNVTYQNFSELEIIVHCLYEMTFIGFEEEIIQDKMKSLQKSIDDWNQLTEEEKKAQSFTLEELKKKWGWIDEEE